MEFGWNHGLNLESHGSVIITITFSVTIVIHNPRNLIGTLGSSDFGPKVKGPQGSKGLRAISLIYPSTFNKPSHFLSEFLACTLS